MTIHNPISVYTSTKDQRYQLTEREPIQPVQGPAENDRVTHIRVNPEITYQEIDGFGASFTDSSAYLLDNLPGRAVTEEVIARLFGRDDGIGLSVIRQPMGATDFAREFYSYDDRPDGETDMDLRHFSIDRDRESIIPLLQTAFKFNPQIKLMASPWSPPGWMKTSGSMIGGSLRRECYAVYADYFVRFIKAYEQEGLPVHFVTPQNEPLYTPGHYPGMLMTAEEQAEFINSALGPAFEANGITAKILAYDHNWDEPDYPLYVLEKAHRYAAGTAWHHYAGTPEAQTRVRDAFPDKEVYFSEGSGGEWVPPFEAAYFEIIREGIGILRNWSKCFVLWNVALDEKNGPMPCDPGASCRGLVTVHSVTKEVIYNLDYYAIGHFSKFIKPGAVRIESDSHNDGVMSLACKNRDGSYTLVCYNSREQAEQIRVDFGGSVFEYQMDGISAVTFAWQGDSD